MTPGGVSHEAAGGCLPGLKMGVGMFKTMIAAICMLGLMLSMLPMEQKARAAALNPRCVANYCPTCPQPLGAARHDKRCQLCLKKNLKRIMNCSKSAGSSALSPAIIGLWQSNTGVSMLVVQTTLGFKGHLHNAPDSLRNTYNQANMEIMNASRSGRNSYQGSFLLPGGKWASAEFTVSGNGMTSTHAGGKSIRWVKRGR